jgi:hypothetical protein
MVRYIINVPYYYDIHLWCWHYTQVKIQQDLKVTQFVGIETYLWISLSLQLQHSIKQFLLQ